MDKALSNYKENSDAMIRDILLEYECQPILFIGSGISRRYFDAPDWSDLLRRMAGALPDGVNKYNYLQQKYSRDSIAVGSALADSVFEWAWGEGRSAFPTEMFSPRSHSDDFIKFLVSDHLSKITPSLGSVSDTFRKEILALRDIKPHAIITTNYDLFLEGIFDGYATVTGQTIIKYNTNSFGEIYHIHGDVTDHRSLVLTRRDYDEWVRKKKYVSAKLLTYFAEHPVFIFGYGMNDPNVKAILRDIGELVAEDGGYIKNVVLVVWHAVLPESPSDQAVFSVDDVEYRVRAIHTTEFKWIFDALKSRAALTSVNPKLVRALAARTMKLIRHDIPSGIVQVNYDVLERVASSDDTLPTLLGISMVTNANETHPYILSQVAKRLKMRGWHDVGKLINRIKSERGIDIRTSDNKYHCKIKTGKTEASYSRKWSQLAVDLFAKVKAGEVYELDL